ncbi:MAG TPA: ribulose-phosphate 3-epimerase [Limnochordia bacterium]|nr:ribulose-phosphate 3-epimerase [Limnochordia bacterium]
MNRRISASILAADFCRLGAELARVSNADLIHFDVMDGHFVPNISFGLPVIEAVSRCTEVPLDVHLMIEQPERYLDAFAAVQPEIITVHYEAVVHLQRTLRRIRELGCKAGVSLNPHTPLEGLRYVLDDLDLILIMTVNPGFGGQQFIPAMLGKIRDCRELISGRPIEIQVDGGVSLENISRLAEAGATNFVAGSAIFQAPDPAAYISQMRSA